MKQFKSLFVAAVCSTLTFAGFSQTETSTDDNNCQSTRWFIVKNSDENAALFASLPEIFEEIKRQSDLNLLYATREMQEVGPMVDENGNPIIKTSETGGHSLVYQNKTVTLVQSDVPLIDSEGNPIIRTMDDGSQSFVYPNPEIVGLNTDVPLVDENGKPIIKTLDDGSMSFVYASHVNFTVQPRIHGMTQSGEATSMTNGNSMEYSISEASISELRIIQSRTKDPLTGEYSADFHVSRIAFCMNPSATQQERLWIDLISFFENMENPEENAFYSLLSEAAFSGFQYKQTPCN